MIGAGTAGLVTALVAAGLGAKVALVERHLLGGDCLNVGCVPSKARDPRGAHGRRGARRRRSSASACPPSRQPDFGAAMERMRRIRARISHDDSAARYRDELGVDVFLGDARFTGRGRVEVGGATLRFKKAVIATGARAVAPPIAGLAEAGYLTNETVFNLTERPRRLAVIGAGPIGCELAQAFRRLGSEVTLLEHGAHILPREDPDAARDRAGRLRARRHRARARLQDRSGSSASGDEKVAALRERGGPRASARRRRDPGRRRAARPTSRASGSKRVGVALRRAAAACSVDDYLRTTNPRIYAAGDICMAWKFTHAADAAAKIVVQNALFFGAQEALVARDAVVHLHRPRGRARRPVRARGARARASRSTPITCRSRR